MTTRSASTSSIALRMSVAAPLCPTTLCLALQSFSAMTEVKSIFPGIDQIIIYLVAIIVLLTRPRGLMGRKGVMEE